MDISQARRTLTRLENKNAAQGQKNEKKGWIENKHLTKV
jgi:hypothetical protein